MKNEFWHLYWWAWGARTKILPQFYTGKRNAKNQMSRIPTFRFVKKRLKNSTRIKRLKGRNDKHWELWEELGVTVGPATKERLKCMCIYIYEELNLVLNSQRDSSIDDTKCGGADRWSSILSTIFLLINISQNQLYPNTYFNTKNLIVLQINLYMG